MKKLVLLFILTSNLAYSQNYFPFDENRPKRFVNINDLSDNDRFFYAHKTEVSGDSTVYSQYFRMIPSSIATHPGCMGWGGDEGPTGDTTWLGRTIVYDQVQQILRLKNSSNEDLTFDFSLAMDDSALFYSDANNEYYIKHSDYLEDNILTTTDSVKEYLILHYDDLGNVVNSPLHNEYIVLSKEHGLTRFINCKDFPADEENYEIMGILNPMIGKYQITYDELYPWQVGDQVQYYGVHSYFGGPQLTNKQWRMHTVTDRIETADSVWIHFDVTSFEDFNPIDFNPMTTYNIWISNPLVFEKGKNLTEYPSGMMPYFDSHHRKSDSIDVCGMREQWTFSPDFTGYCDSCECMIPYDGFGVTPLTYQKFRAGHGKTAANSVHYGPPQNYPNQSAYQIYSNIGGVECGNQAFVGDVELMKDIRIYPNPATDEIKVVTTSPAKSIQLVNLKGQIVLEATAEEISGMIDISSLAKGVYHVLVTTETGASMSSIVKE